MTWVVLQILEEDYGCEGVPDGEEPMCHVLLRDEDGSEVWKRLPDRFLTENRITEGSRYCVDSWGMPSPA